MLSALGVIVPLCVSFASLLKKLPLSKLSSVSASTFNASTNAFVTLASINVLTLVFV